jgi:toxin CptA
VSSLPDHFECHWKASRTLLAAYLVAQCLALVALYVLALPGWAFWLGLVLCGAHGVWTLPGSILLQGPRTFTGLRRTSAGWQLWSRRDGWQPVQLRRDSIALPLMVVLRFRLSGKGCVGRRLVHGLCVPRDAMSPQHHRQLRVRLKFSRRRWAAPE